MGAACRVDQAQRMQQDLAGPQVTVSAERCKERQGGA
jgi:hypothetical protein